MERKKGIHGAYYELSYGGEAIRLDDDNFRQRIDHAAKQVGIIDDDTILDLDELEDLAQFVVAKGIIVGRGTPFGEYLEHVTQEEGPTGRDPKDSTLAHWLERLAARSAFIDEAVTMGKVGVSFDPDSGDFVYFHAATGEVIKPEDHPSWSDKAFSKYP